MFPLTLPASSAPLLTLHHPKPYIWIIELQNGVDNRLTEEFILNAINPALDIVETQWRDKWRKAYADKNDKDKKDGYGALIITGTQSQEKFFSNGFDFPFLQKKPWFIRNTFGPLTSRLLTFPIPVIAAINGHSFAAGFGLSMACDFRVMTTGKAWLSMNEVHFGAPLPQRMIEVFRGKVTSPNTLRDIFLVGHRFTAKEALAVGLVDEIVEGGSAGVLAAAVKMADKVAGNAKLGVWGLIKAGLYKDTINAQSERVSEVFPVEEDEVFRFAAQQAKHKAKL